MLHTNKHSPPWLNYYLYAIDLIGINSTFNKRILSKMIQIEVVVFWYYKSFSILNSFYQMHHNIILSIVSLNQFSAILLLPYQPILRCSKFSFETVIIENEIKGRKKWKKKLGRLSPSVGRANSGQHLTQNAKTDKTCQHFVLTSYSYFAATQQNTDVFEAT